MVFVLNDLSKANGSQRNGVSPASISLQPCEVSGANGAKENVRCGTFEVFEDRSARSGRKIALKIVVFPATGQDKAADPLFYIPGGPGSSATEDAPFVAQEFAKILAHRDLVFVDQRGTGGSNPLNCDFFKPSDLRSYFGDYFPLEDVRRCREQLESKANLKLYTTPLAMEGSRRCACGPGLRSNQHYRWFLWDARRAGLSKASPKSRARCYPARCFSHQSVHAARLPATH